MGEMITRVDYEYIHALSSYKDHPYKGQVVHFRKNKDQH